MSAQGFPPAEMQEILQEVTSLLRSRGETICVAETAAGGLVSSALLSSPGASGYYRGGVTLYTLPSRLAYGGWTQRDVEAYRGPTTDIVAGLARHVRGQLGGSTYAVAESGTAGPTGGSAPNRTPGYVALAVDCEKGTFVRELDTGLGTDRVANMKRFAVEALKLVRDVLKGEAKL
ncbi:putative competence/damage-inducible protein CinA [Xylariaceae sp. FL0016]|nr:putative competence/damage-inducible protein CinA [Xylariaceae sp. FL0016]